MALPPLKKKTRLYEDIVQLFMGKIESGELKKGERLPSERELGEQLGVSRTSIREALRAMELLGVITSKVGGGTFVKYSGIDRSFLFNLGHPGPSTDKQVLDTYDVRVVLESHCARLAARNRNDEQLARMREAIAEMREDIARGNRGQKADTEFHMAIAEATDNTFLSSILSLCAERINSSIAIANAHVTVDDILAEHQVMYGAIEEGDEKTAEKLMRAHIKRAYDRVVFILSKSE